ncbi:MAG: hypothetical protein ABWY71_00510 [Candidatus Saccharimonadales bacterium]
MNKRIYFYTFASLLILYAAVVLLSPTDPAVLHKYDITAGAARLLNLTVVIPIIAIWITAFYGHATLKRYAASVSRSAEGASFNMLANGLLVLVMSLPLVASASAILNYIAQRNPGFLSEATIIRNYLNVVSAVLAFYLIGKGAEALAKLVKRKTLSLDNQKWTIGFIIVSGLFSWLVMSHHPAASGHESIYYLPDWLVILTVVIPYLYVWYRGTMAAYCIYFYQKNVKGQLYKRALSFCSAGIAMVIVTSVFIQLLTVFTARLNRLNLTPVLLIIYVLICTYAIGYALIAKGAKKLKTFEEV